MTRYGYYSATCKSKTPQTQPVRGRTDQVKNNAGGYVFNVDNWDSLRRFLILGSSGGTYYVGEAKLTGDNLSNIEVCSIEDGQRVVDMIVDVSVNGRAPKNEPTLVALAICASCGGANPSPVDIATRRAALDALPKVARIGTHLFQFAHYVDGRRGWGNALRQAVGNWYNDKPVPDVAYQAIKYQARTADEGNKASRWSHRDLLRKSHPSSKSTSRNNIYKYITQGWDKIPDRVDKDLAIVEGFERAKRATDAKEVIGLIEKFKLPREAIPTEFLNDTNVWLAMLPDMPMRATIRNLGKMSSLGMFTPMGDAQKTVVDRINDVEYLRKSRMHPLSVLVALKTYESGHGVKGGLTWNTNRAILDALDRAFYNAFDNIESTGNNFYLALDVSSSMTWDNIAGLPGITPAVAAAAMSMVTARTEPNYHIAGFTSGRGSYDEGISMLNISPNQRLDDIVKATGNIPFGGTDCALPMLDAIKKKMHVDTFVILTDNETWAGDIHPTEALRDYRNKFNPEAKLVVVGMTATEFTIADSNDKNQLDVVGLSTDTPSIISEFSKGNI